MTLPWVTKIRGMSLSHLYMLDRLPPGLDDVPPHPLWQAPFAFASADEPLDQMVARVRRAGELWLANYDMHPYQELVIAHAVDPWFMAFQRELRPDEHHLAIGPLGARVMRSTDGAPLWGLPLRYRESEVATSRELWRQVHQMERQ